MKPAQLSKMLDRMEAHFSAGLQECARLRSIIESIPAEKPKEKKLTSVQVDKLRSRVRSRIRGAA